MLKLIRVFQVNKWCNNNPMDRWCRYIFDIFGRLVMFFNVYIYSKHCNQFQQPNGAWQQQPMQGMMIHIDWWCNISRGFPIMFMLKLIRVYQVNKWCNRTVKWCNNNPVDIWFRYIYDIFGKLIMFFNVYILYLPYLSLMIVDFCLIYILSNDSFFHAAVTPYDISHIASSLIFLHSLVL